MKEDRFTELLAKKMTGELSADESAEFNKLISVNKSYRAEYEQLKDYWAQEARTYPNMQGILAEIKEQAGITQQQTRSYAWIGRTAAILFLTISAVFAYRFFLSKEKFNETTVSWKEVKASSGQVLKLTLADGSRITLNSESGIRYPEVFSGQSREVHLDGEAYFDVAEDHDHPFILHTQEMDIRVLGTAFNVKSYKNDPVKEATLFRGSIEVNLPGLQDKKLKLKPADKIKINGSAYELGKMAYYNAGDQNSMEILWMDNQLAFKNESLESIAHSMARRYGLKMIFNNPATKKLKFSGSFEKETISEALNSLQTVTPFTYKIQRDSVYFY
ncbi:transmembrane sensor [Pedobacter africanus]|uniref:Ferric-dicitrate binding protein FerR (Iron transport regulator) n=1 Tax=Pedobacter africanus TaxID=151894 RepID=A0ACC6L524_9SPHI|nr:FecR domain-containing protein [Pedobacter africanus]MDR6786591.1 ferric-dicitrate binding protein FerR (iron transport regulator) [Pedobacter africanus]